MKSASHFAMAQLLYTAMRSRGCDLNLVPFIYGNIAPDYSPKIIIKPHFTRVCEKQIDARIHSLSKKHVSKSGRLDADYAVELGMLCHYLCDYFCFAHSKEFFENLKVHRAYESDLDEFLREKCFELLDIEGAESLSEYASPFLLRRGVDKAKETYTENGCSYANDLESAFNICMNCIMSLIRLSQRVERHKPRILYYDFNDIEFIRLAAFRMFLYRNRDSELLFLNLDLSAI